MLARNFLIVLSLFVPISSYADPPPGTDLTSPLHDWFERQHSIAGAWCCDLSDGHILEDEDWRITSTSGNASGYEIHTAGRWVGVPTTAIRDTNGGPNPTGKAIAWYRLDPEYGIRIYCFAPGTML